MKIVKILGGLGNQMFQYAFLLALRESSGDEVLMDTSVFDTYKLHNGFELERVFNISARKATKEELKRLTRYTTSYFLSRIYNKLLPPLKTEFREKYFYQYYPEALICSKDKYYEGYWQNHQYFQEVKSRIFKDFDFRNPMDERNASLCREIKENPISVSLHIRRGDYLNNKLYRNLCGLDYYKAAIDYVLRKYGNNVNFYLFSNDIGWCKENILPIISSNRIVIVDWNKGADSYKDMMLMSSCNINIIANSSFSWWAAYLNRNENKEICSPKKWVNLPMEFSIQMLDWTLF